MPLSGIQDPGQPNSYTPILPYDLAILIGVGSRPLPQPAQLSAAPLSPVHLSVFHLHRCECSCCNQTDSFLSQLL